MSNHALNAIRVKKLSIELTSHLISRQVPTMSHLYEIVFESSQMWLKIQASCRSQEQATAFFEFRFGGNAPDPLRPHLRNVLFSFLVPRKLSECSGHIFNWDAIKDRLPTGWDDWEFRVVEGPYLWCETLSVGCDCHGAKGRLDVVYCSDFGMQDEIAKRANKSPNVWHSEYLQEMRRILVSRQNASRANSNAATGDLPEPPEQEGFFCQVDRCYHVYSEQVKQKVAANIAAISRSSATRSEKNRREVMSTIRGLNAHLLRTFQFQECAERLVEGRADVPNILYKYLPRDRIGKGAPNSLRATQLLALNDDMECNVVTMHNKETDILDFLALVQSRLKECLGIEVTDQELMERSLRYGDLRLSSFIQEYLNPRVGVVSLSTDLLVPTMWAHYARNTGIVVGYDTEALRGLGFELRQVSYSELAPIYEPTKRDVIHLKFANREQMERDSISGRTRQGIPILGSVDLTHLGADWKTLSRVLFVKGSFWEYEREVRLLVDLQDARDTGKKDCDHWPVKVIDIPPEAIKEIYGGATTSDADLAQAIEVARGGNKGGLYEGHVSSHGFRIQKTVGGYH